MGVLAKLAGGLLAAGVLFNVYECAGCLYKHYNTSHFFPEGTIEKPYYNREVNDDFLNEFRSEMQALEDMLPHYSVADKTNVSVSVYVSPEVKYFYDDANNENDNSRWADIVGSSIRGLEFYEDFGYHFNVSIYPLGENQCTAPVSKETLMLPFLSSCLPQSAIENLFPQEAFKGQYNDNADISIAINAPLRGIGGYTFINGNNSVISPKFHQGLNELILAHEIGHILGLDHRETIGREKNFHIFFLDPFRIFVPRGLMQPKVGYADWDINDAEYEILENSRSRFERNFSCVE